MLEPLEGVRLAGILQGTKDCNRLRGVLQPEDSTKLHTPSLQHGQPSTGICSETCRAWVSVESRRSAENCANERADYRSAGPAYTMQHDFFEKGFAASTNCGHVNMIKTSQTKLDLAANSWRPVVQILVEGSSLAEPKSAP